VPELGADLFVELATQPDPEGAGTGAAPVRPPVESQGVVLRVRPRRDPDELEVLLGKPETSIARSLACVLDALVEDPPRSRARTAQSAPGSTKEKRWSISSNTTPMIETSLISKSAEIEPTTLTLRWAIAASG
jgi:hypothetical protein